MDETNATESRLSRLSPEQRAALALRAMQKLRPGADKPKTSASQISADLINRFSPFPLTDLQQAYWVGRNEVFGMGKLATHIYMEVDGENLDMDRLNGALRRLIQRHDILRATVLESGQQQVLKQVPDYEIKVADLRQAASEKVAEHLDQTRYSMSHHVLPSDQWPLFEIRATLFDSRKIRLHCSFDGLILDGWSVFLLFREWDELYHNPGTQLPELEITFRDYVLAEAAAQSAPEYKAAGEYWRKRVATLPPAPDLPTAGDPANLKDPRFIRRIERMDAETWGRLKARATQAGLTPPGLLVAAYAEVLSVWSRSPRFTINVPRFNRVPLHSQVESLLGEFASFTLLEVDHTVPAPFQVRAKRIQEQLWADLDHSRFSGVQVLREMALQQGTLAAVTMPVVFTCFPQDQNKNASLLTAPGRLGQVVHSISQSSQVWLDNHVYEQNGDLVCDWDSIEEIFPAGLSVEMLGAYFRLLRVLATREDLWHRSASDLRPHIIGKTLATSQLEQPLEYAAVPDLLVHELFIAQAYKRPEAAAVVANDRTLSYGQLFGLSTQIGRRLRELGARPNTLVGVVMEKGWEQIVGVLSVLQSGAAYLPIDPDLPRDRIHYLLQHGEVKSVLTQRRIDSKISWPDGVQRLVVDDNSWTASDATALELIQQADDLMYVLYTSGSTGVPKGVMVAHRGVVNALVETNDTFAIKPSDRVLALTALHHDMSVFDIFGVLAAGGTIVMPQAAGRKDPAHWSDLMKQHQITIWNSVPAMLEMAVEYAESHPGALPDTLRLAFSGGDWIPVTLPDRLRKLASKARLVSVGGPTETTLWNIWYPVDRVDPKWRSIPYGKPIPNTKYYVLNDALEDCPTWVTGELCCAGVGVAKGYWRDEEKTRAKFVRHPVTGERIYRTGDLGRFMPDGNIEFMGRTDFQVKIQGQRIELGEIESALQQHPMLRSAVVSVTGERAGRKRLVAYVVTKSPEMHVNGELSDYLKDKLPEHMIPAAFLKLDQLPLTPNGKVDRRALPDLAEEANQEKTQSSNPTSDIQARILKLVSQVLQAPQMRPGDSILSHGANSIDMVKIGNQLEKEFGSRPRMDQLFRFQTVAAIAKYYEESNLVKPAAQPVAFETRRMQGAKEIISTYKMLLDPKDREAFKKTQPGLRRDVEEKQFVQLEKPALSEELLEQYRKRRSYRKFSLKPIPFEKLSLWLARLAEQKVEGKPKYLYSSPGGLYPSQVYLHAKPGRIEGVESGIYYYHPVQHRLISMTPNVEIDRSIHVPFINTPTFDEAAFSVFFIASMAAIAPSYGEDALHFARLETGLMAHLLETTAPEFGIGICQIGDIDFSSIRPYFNLSENHVMIHSMVGGWIPTDEVSSTQSDTNQNPAAKVESLLSRIKQLSKEEVQALLAAQKGQKRSQ